MFRWWRPEVSGLEGLGGRLNHASAVVGSRLFVFGGSNSAQTLASMHVLDLETLHWSTPRVFGDAAKGRENHTMTAVGLQLVVFGGSADPDACSILGDLLLFHTGSCVWQSVRATPRPGARFGHSAIAHAHQVVVFGGYGADRGEHLNDLHIFDMETRQWRVDVACTGAVPSPRASHSAVVCKAHMVVYGGCADALTQRPSPAVHCLDLKTHVWTTCTSTCAGGPPPARYLHASVSLAECMVVYGGTDGSREFSDMWSWSLDALNKTGKWSRYTERSPVDQVLKGRWAHSMCAVLNKLFVVGGKNYSGSAWPVLGDVVVMDVSCVLGYLAADAMQPYEHSKGVSVVPANVAQDEAMRRLQPQLERIRHEIYAAQKMLQQEVDGRLVFHHSRSQLIAQLQAEKAELADEVARLRERYES